MTAIGDTKSLSADVIGGRSSTAKPGRIDRILVGLVVIGIALRVLLSTTRLYQVDEVEHVHAAFLIAKGWLPYRDFLEVHTPALHFLLRPLIVADDPGLTFGLARSFMMIPGLATILLVFLVGRRVWSRRAALWGAALLAWHTTFAERGMEIRPDAWIAVTTLAALWIELSDRGSVRRRAFLSGLSIGVGLAFSQKAVFMLAGFGLIWAWRAVQDRDVRPLLLASLGGVLPLAVICLAFAGWGAGEELWSRVVLRPAEALLGQADASRTRAFTPWAFLGLESARNLVFVAATLLGAVVVIRDWRVADSNVRRRLAVLGSVQLSLLVYLVANPYPYPYLHVAVLPAWAVLAGVGCTRAGAALRSRAASVVVGTVAWLAVAGSFVPRILAKAGDTHETQVALMEEVAGLTDPEDAVFDAVGLYFRPSAAYMFFMPEGVLAEYESGVYPALTDDLRQRQAVVVMLNYRVAGYLSAQDRGFLVTHFVHYRSNILVLGASFQGLGPGDAIEFEVLKTKRFRFTGPRGAIVVDGEDFIVGELSRGVHQIDVRVPLEGGVLIMEPPGKRYPDAPPEQIYVNFD